MNALDSVKHRYRNRLAAALVLCVVTWEAVVAKENSAPIASVCWRPIQLEFSATSIYENPYRDVEVWIDLKGRESRYKVYGFWDGQSNWKVRFITTAPGRWQWTLHCSHDDPGLSNQQGSINTRIPNQGELESNPNLHGIVTATNNGHALQYRDGTPFFLLADTAWAASTAIMPFDSDDSMADISFKAFVRQRKKQGFNSLAFVSAFPNWDPNPRGDRLVVDGIVVRSHGAQWRATLGHDEDLNRPFLLLDQPRISGVPVAADFWRINPDYYKNLDRKMQFSFEQGFVPFLETIRRDHGQSLRAWTPDWEEAFARYLQYLVARYGCYNIIFSALHYDWDRDTIPVEEWKKAIDLHFAKHGRPPFGQLTTALTCSRTDVDWGRKTPWLLLHGVGNQGPRNNRYGQWIFEQFHFDPPKPTINQEPIYPGRDGGNQSNALSHAWTSVFSGALAGHIYGSQFFSGVHARKALSYGAAPQMPHLKTFVHSFDGQFIDLVPRTKPSPDFDGQVLLLRSADPSIVAVFVQHDGSMTRLTDLKADSTYEVALFDPLAGKFLKTTMMKVDDNGAVDLRRTFPELSNAAQPFAIRAVRADTSVAE